MNFHPAAPITASALLAFPAFQACDKGTDGAAVADPSPSASTR
ncbi:MAG: hypothetical protein JWP91_3180 [Fibrobacteres bacterium]|nr:hypothetical protein [Fibrobacterota bacterium]